MDDSPCLPNRRKPRAFRPIGPIACLFVVDLRIDVGLGLALVLRRARVPRHGKGPAQSVAAVVPAARHRRKQALDARHAALFRRQLGPEPFCHRCVDEAGTEADDFEVRVGLALDLSQPVQRRLRQAVPLAESYISRGHLLFHRGVQCIKRKVGVRKERLELGVLVLQVHAGGSRARVYNPALSLVDQVQHGLRDALRAIVIRVENGVHTPSPLLSQAHTRVVDKSVQRNALRLEGRSRRGARGIVCDVDLQRLDPAGGFWMRVDDGFDSSSPLLGVS
mmetsp:Transcript_19017/g.32967  ORF Transcript_19017/g.32967 Transcript_19017/m.32967 type:complete len:278 (-) Transcript_19017:155-988(-)